MPKHVNPHGGKTTNWRAGCGRSARPVRREGESQALPTPIKLDSWSPGRYDEPLAVRRVDMRKIWIYAALRVEGRREALQDLLALLEPFDYWFNIVTP